MKRLTTGRAPVSPDAPAELKRATRSEGLDETAVEGPGRKDFDRFFWRTFVEVCAWVDGDVPGPHADEDERSRWEETAQRIVDDLVAAEERRRWEETAEIVGSLLV